MNKEPILLSILIPSIPSRFAMLQTLVASIESQIGDLPVELLYLGDNKRMSIGKKRDLLMQMANGKMACFSDDDDFIHPNFCSEVVAAIRANPDADVVVFSQHAVLDGKKFTVHFGLENVNEQAQILPDGQFVDIRRLPFPCCPWRTSLAKKYHFPDQGMSEDWDFIQQLLPEAKNQARIEKVLHTYRYNSATSEGDQTIQAREEAAKKAKEENEIQPA